MKLIKCHIENYGNIGDADYSFDGKLTELCEENGYGKTTLASFIKAMFYGLPAYTDREKNDKDLPERKRYYPFNGGKFGGSLTFEMGSTEYRIERFFGKKSAKDDTLAVYCNNKKFNGFGDDVGKAVFGLDKDSFNRTVFVNSDAIDICATGGISAKLNNFVTDLKNGNTVDAVVGVIEKAKKKLKADKGGNGSIKETNQEVSDITDSIRNLKSIEKSLESSYAEASKLKQNIMRQNAEIEEIKSRNLLIEHWQQYEKLSDSQNRIACELDGLNEKYPHGIPTESEIADMKSRNRQMVALYGQKDATVFDETKRQRLDELSAVFADGVPSEEFLQDIKSDVEDIRNSEAQLNALSEQGQSERFDELKQKFDKGVPEDEEIAKLEKQVERYGELDNRQKAKTNVAVEGNRAARKSGKFIAFAAIAAIIAVVGVGLLFVNAIVGGIISGVGAVGLLVVGFLYLKNLSMGRQTVVVDEGLVKLQAEMQQIEGAVRESLVRYGYYSKNGIAFDLEMLKKDIREYVQTQESAVLKEQGLGERRELIDKKTKKVKAVFDKYGIDEGGLQNSYIKLQNMVSVMTAMLADSEDIGKTQDRIVKDIEKCHADITAIMTKYGVEMSENLAEQLDELAAALSDYTRLCGEKEKVDADMSEYKSKYGLKEKPTEEIVDTSEIAERLKDNQHELAVLESNIANDERAVEDLEDKCSQLENAKEKLKSYENKYKILKATIEFLKIAEQNLKDRYIAPVRDNFLYYANMLESTLGEKISVDQDFNIMFERGGENRSDKHLSDGQHSLCALCFRLALINNMYETEKPFIVMDDPFVHLDEKHMERTRKAVKELSENNQIIYFSCHKSRRIEA